MRRRAPHRLLGMTMRRIHEDRRLAWSSRLATGTLACPECDAPVAPPERWLAPSQWLSCPYCDHGAAAREFLSLAAPPRPARVAVRVVPTGAAAARPAASRLAGPRPATEG
jgi:hypothetical protein